MQQRKGSVVFAWSMVLRKIGVWLDLVFSVCLVYSVAVY